MLSKCANPQCPTILHYLRAGKVYRVEVKEEISGESPFLVSPEMKRKSRVQHYWLCGECILKMTLHFDKQGRLSVIPKSVKAPAVQDFSHPIGPQPRLLVKKAAAS